LASFRSLSPGTNNIERKSIGHLILQAEGFCTWRAARDHRAKPPAH
jgi:hypothetical protein